MIKKLSIITPTYNNERDIEKFLKSIRSQDFPQSRLEIIAADGGSHDKTISILRKYKVKILQNKDRYADVGVNLGMEHASGDVLMVLAADNIFKAKDSLKRMMEVFENEGITAAFPRHAFLNNDTIYTKYMNTFTDPANHFVYGYACNPRTFHKVYGIKEKNKTYTLFDYKSSKIVPLIAFAQGFCVRAEFKRSRRNKFDDIAPVMELISKNKGIAYVHSVDLYHHTVSGFKNFVVKQAWKTGNYLEKKNYGIAHRVKLLSQPQTSRIRFWPIYSLLIFPTIMYSLYHLIKDKEPMWILHPFMCIISAYTSFFVVILYRFKK